MIIRRLPFASSLVVLLAGQFSRTAAFTSPPSLASRPPQPLPVTSDGSPTAAGRKRSSLSAVREATFGMGCFWEPSESLLKQTGVIATTVGYTGAPPNKPPPTYDSVCFGKDWVEAVRVAYDDEVVSYDQLLDYFFELQKPGYSRQYASIIFADDSAEEKDAKKWQKSASSSENRETVEIERTSPFYRAEEYHQRYWEKQRVRYAIGLALIAGESGAYNNLFDGALADLEVFGLSFDGVCGALFFAGAAWLLAERAVARNPRELKIGDLTATATKS